MNIAARYERSLREAKGSGKLSKRARGRLKTRRRSWRNSERAVRR